VPRTSARAARLLGRDDPVQVRVHELHDDEEVVGAAGAQHRVVEADHVRVPAQQVHEPQLAERVPRVPAVVGPGAHALDRHAPRAGVLRVDGAADDAVAAVADLLEGVVARLEALEDEALLGRALLPPRGLGGLRGALGRLPHGRASGGRGSATPLAVFWLPLWRATRPSPAGR
jgi:hypothetical protein